MSTLPAAHRAQSHADIRRALSVTAEAAFASGTGAPGWNPLLPLDLSTQDLGTGALDGVALALHVLWTYQEAWAAETFLSTARLETSVSRLLGHIGYSPSPGTAATGLQIFRVKPGATGFLPRGFAVLSKPEGEQAQATYETLAPLRLEPDLASLRVYLPPRERPTRTPPLKSTGTPPSLVKGEPRAPSGGLLSSEPASNLAALQDRLDVQRHGPLEARRAARARQDARRLAGMVQQLDTGTDGGCQAALDALCEQLCEAQAIAAEPVPSSGRPIGSLSESQEILARQLRNLKKRQAGAIVALEDAMAPFPGESADAHAKRLDGLTTFLDAFVAGLIQEARDQWVLLRGADALNRMDAILTGEVDAATSGAGLGVALPGTDALYVLPHVGPDGVPHAPPLRPGDWLVVAEDLERTGPDGRLHTERLHREAVRVIRVRAQTPPGERTQLTHVQFTPPLSRHYALHRVELCGNAVPVSEGAFVEEVVTVQPGATSVPLREGPLTWLRDATAPGGRRAEVDLTVGDRRWQQRDSLLDAGPEDPVFVVEPLPGGKSQLRLGGFGNGAALPPNATLRLRYRVGLGAHGNRAAHRVSELASAHPSVEGTFNPLPMTQGSDPETPDNARTHGPQRVGAMDRAVSSADVQALTLLFDGVHRARVVQGPAARRRALQVVVSGPHGAALAKEELQALHAFLAARVAPGVTLTLRNRVVSYVRARVLLRLSCGADPISLLQEVRLRLGLADEPDRPPGLLSLDVANLGRDLQLSDLYGALTGVPHLGSCVVQRLHREGEAAALAPRIVAAADELLTWAPAVETSEGVELRHEQQEDL